MIENLSIRLLVFSLVIGLFFTAFSIDKSHSGTIPIEGCELTIFKSATPADGTVFAFEVTGAQESMFSLDDPGDTSEGGIIPIDQSLTVTELVTEGWELESIECIQGVQNCSNNGGFVPCLSISIDVDNNSITAECSDFDAGSCTFNNVKTASAVPTLSQYALVAVAIFLGLIAFIGFRRKKAQS